MPAENEKLSTPKSDSGIDHRDYFCDEAGTRAFNASFIKLVGEMQRDVVGTFLRRENAQRFNHGGDWAHPGSPEASGGVMKLHSAEVETKFADLVNHDLDLIDRIAGQLRSELERQFAKTLYQTVSDAADRVGNTIDARGTDLAEAFYKAIERVQFSANRDEQVSRPDFHLHPDLAKRMLAALEAAPPEFRARLDELTAKKTQEAIDRERERKSKFVRYKARS